MVDVRIKLLQSRVLIIFEMKKGCKVSYVKIIGWLMVVKECINILIFYVFKYGAECGTESNAK